MKKIIRAGVWMLLAALLIWGSALGEMAAESRIDAWMEAQAETQKDPWVRAILNAGARDITWTGEKAVFFLRGYDPDLKSLGAYQRAADRAAWRQAAAENIRAYRLVAELAFGEDGNVMPRSGAALLNLVKKAAGAAKGSLAKKDWTDAMTDLMFPAPVKDRKVDAARLMTADDAFSAFILASPELYPCESPSEWAPLFYVQRNWKYRMNDGPEQMVLTWDGADPVRFLNQAYDLLTGTLASKTRAEREAESSLPYLWRSALAETAVKMKKGRLTSMRASFSLDELLEGKLPEGYEAYVRSYHPADYYTQLVEGYRLMPDEAALPLPKNGPIRQVKKGRGVMIKVPKDGRNTYVQLRDADTGVIQAEGFVLPGKNITLKVPEGVYTVQYATGSTWYGTEKTFGATGHYTASEEFIIAKKKWTLTPETPQTGITLRQVTAAEMLPTEDKSVHVEGRLGTDIPLREYPAVNPAEPGISPTTGLAASGEAYTPIVMVLDNAEDAYPHWGVREADILFQVPNAGSGATKLLALFADHYPQQAGPVRSGRSTMLPAALSMNAALVFAGPPAVTGGPVDILEQMNQFGMSRTHRVYNLLSANDYGERIKGIGSHNLSCRIGAIHENLLAQGTEFEIRPFLFTDEPRTEGPTANIIKVLHRGEDPEGPSNSASRAVFKYEPEKGTYTRTNSSGVYIDRETGETLHFANVIVLRAQLSYDRNYLYFTRHMAGSGTIEIFQNGKYARGAWVRSADTGRLVLVDADGSELKLQRGKTFLVMTNDISNVIFSE